MTESSDETFWKNEFDTAGNFPGWWFEKSLNLLTAADVLDTYTGTVFDELKARVPPTPHRRERMSVVGVTGMLRAMATECLLKALWLKHGGTLAKDGRYLGVLKRNEHRLNKLAEALSKESDCVFTDRELELLDFVSPWITSGRYPIQRTFNDLVPFSRPDGTVAPKQFWRGNPIEELKTLTARLQTMLTSQ